MAARKLKKSFNAKPTQEEVNDFVAAAFNGKPEGIIAFLDKYPAAIDAQDHRWGRALGEAVRRGRKEIVETLIDRGADVNAKDRFGETPLKHAAAFGDAGIVELLLENGADINAEYNNGFTTFTPLKMAQEFFNAENSDGETALMMAVSCDKPETAAFLEQWREEKIRQKARELAAAIADFSPALKRDLPVPRSLKLPPRAH